jgi:hypothetical protein
MTTSAQITYELTHMHTHVPVTQTIYIRDAKARELAHQKVSCSMLAPAQEPAHMRHEAICAVRRGMGTGINRRGATFNIRMANHTGLQRRFTKNTECGTAQSQAVASFMTTTTT